MAAKTTNRATVSQMPTGKRAVTALFRFRRYPDYVQSRVLTWDLVNFWRAASEVDAPLAVACWSETDEMGNTLRREIPMEEVATLFPLLPPKSILHHLIYDHPAAAIAADALPPDCVAGVWRECLSEDDALRALVALGKDDPLGRALRRGVSAKEATSAWKEVLEDWSLEDGFELWDRNDGLGRTLRNVVDASTFLTFWRQIPADHSAWAFRLLRDAPRRIQACIDTNDLVSLLESSDPQVREGALTLLGVLRDGSPPSVSPRDPSPGSGPAS